MRRLVSLLLVLGLSLLAGGGSHAVGQQRLVPATTDSLTSTARPLEVTKLRLPVG